MATADRLLVDTNVLLEATDEGRPFHTTARALVESGRALVLTAQVIREYLVAVTRPVASNGLGLSTGDALENIRQFRRVIRLLPEEKPVLPVFLRLIEAVPCAGKRIHDAHLMATAAVHGIRTVVSLNVDDLVPFRRGIDVTTPGTVMQEPVNVRSSRAPRPARPTKRLKKSAPLSH